MRLTDKLIDRIDQYFSSHTADEIIEAYNIEIMKHSEVKKGMKVTPIDKTVGCSADECTVWADARNNGLDYLVVAGWDRLGNTGSLVYYLQAPTDMHTEHVGMYSVDDFAPYEGTASAFKQCADEISKVTEDFIASNKKLTTHERELARELFIASFPVTEIPGNETELARSCVRASRDFHKALREYDCS